MSLAGVIAVDGPSGTGKSSVTRLLAETLGARYLDTGAMYRAVTWAVLRRGVDPADALAVTQVARSVRLEISTDPTDQWVTVDGERVDTAIRGVEVTAAVSAVSAVPALRSHLVALQREIIGSGGIVVEGRDIGTTVWPAAQLKIYLTAHPMQRALRRARQDGGGTDRDVAAAAEALRRRDALDSGRSTSPLRPAADATTVDTTEMTQREVVRRLLQLATERELVVESHPALPGQRGPEQRGPAPCGPAPQTVLAAGRTQTYSGDPV